MRRRRTLPPILALAVAAAPWLIVGAASAQTGQADTGRRYLGWSGRPASVAPAATGPAAARTASDLRPGLTPGLIPHAGIDRSPYPLRPAFAPATPSSGRNALTPADAWLRPAPSHAAVASPPPAPHPAPIASAPTLPPPPAVPSPTTAATSATVPPPSVLDPSPVVADPYAPRRDAPIFRLGAASPPPSAPQAAEADSPAPRPADDAGSRYYSVHRQAGREPDATTLPEPFFLDAMPESLAQPPEPPAMMRDAQGRLRPVSTPDGGDPTLQ